MQYDFGEVKRFICYVLWSFLGSWFGQAFIHGNQDAINIIVTVFSILAGFLIAVITLLGDPGALPSGSWRIARLGSERTYNRLLRHKWLFILYLVTLLIIFISVLVKDKIFVFQKILEHLYVFLSCLSAFYSFSLPSSLINLQKERIECEIDTRRKSDGIED